MTWLFFILSSVVWAQNYDYAYDGKIYLNPATMANCMLLVADQYPEARVQPPFESYQNAFHTGPGWDCTVEKDTADGWYRYFTASQHRLCDFATGKEEDLKKWVMEQPDNSIDPVIIFEKSMSLNKGNIQNALLTIHQSLRNNARFSNKTYYNYKSTKAEAKQFWNKFVDIRGDLEELKKGGEGDHTGSWYRLWGMALYRVKEGYPYHGDKKKDERGTCVLQSDNSMIGRGKENLEAFTMAIGAEAVKYYFDLTGSYKAGGDRGGKAKINNFGADLGGFIASYNSKGALDLSPEYRKKTFEKICADKGYMTRQPAKRPK